MSVHPAPSHTYRAIAMELVAYLDEQFVELLIMTDSGESIAVACPRDSILSIQGHINQLVHECPEIESWGAEKTGS